MYMFTKEKKFNTILPVAFYSKRMSVGRRVQYITIHSIVCPDFFYGRAACVCAQYHTLSITCTLAFMEENCSYVCTITHNGLPLVVKPWVRVQSIHHTNLPPIFSTYRHVQHISYHHFIHKIPITLQGNGVGVCRRGVRSTLLGGSFLSPFLLGLPGAATCRLCFEPPCCLSGASPLSLSDRTFANALTRSAAVVWFAAATSLLSTPLHSSSTALSCPSFRPFPSCAPPPSVVLPSPWCSIAARYRTSQKLDTTSSVMALLYSVLAVLLGAPSPSFTPSLSAATLGRFVCRGTISGGGMKASARFLQSTQRQMSVHGMPAWKHSQYFFRHPDFLQ
eukprot:comp83792_c0_seq1/m.48441 comp83792_c0_seq1/g.48441  ORF comp83792_c0_seq1/g.48441 comp83792_c0_seq1/m.48441 type:complete len:335 (+) comp83792_c0_seq1:322-1326(+)